MLFGLILLVSFDQHVFLQFYYKTIILPKIAKFQVRSFENILYYQKVYKNNTQDIITVTLVFHTVFELLLLQNGKIS